MSAHTTSSADRTSTFTRRTMLKSLAGGTAAAALLAAGRLADASPPRANRETGSAPALGELSAFTGNVDTTAAPKRYERRTPD